MRIGGRLITDRWSSIQAVTAELRLALEKDEEFGNAQSVAQDFAVPEVSGTVEVVKPRDTNELLKRVRQIAGITTDSEVVGPNGSAVLTLKVILHSPTDGSILQTIWVPDARFTMPGFSGQGQDKIWQDASPTLRRAAGRRGPSVRRATPLGAAGTGASLSAASAT